MLVKRLLSMRRSLLWPKMLLVVFLAFLVLTFIMPHAVLAQTQDYGLGAVRSWGIFGETSLVVFLGRLVQVFLGLLGIIAVLIIMYAGFIWMTAAGDPAKIAKAKKILTNAIIGMIIIFASFALTSFVISMLQGAARTGGGGPGNYPGSPFDPYRSAIGRGPIASVYPAPNAVNIPINTWIAVTFKEPIEWDSVHTTSSGAAIINNIEICEISANSNSCLGSASSTFTMADLASSSIAMTADGKTIIITPDKYLGNEDSRIRAFKVKLLQGINAVSTGRSIFGTSFGYYEWAFKTNGQLDLDPPEIISSNNEMLGVYPLPDNLIDSYANFQPAIKGRVTTTFSGAPAVNSPTLIEGIPFNVRAEANLRLVSGSVPGGFAAKIKTDSGLNAATSGTLDITVNSNATAVTFSGTAAVGLGLSGTSAPITGNTVNTSIGLIIEGNGPFPQGSAWRCDITASQPGDTFVINVDSIIYRFVFVADSDSRQSVVIRTALGGGQPQELTYQTIKIGTDAASRIFNFANAINASQAYNYLEASANAANVVLVAKAAGSSNVKVSKTSVVIDLDPPAGSADYEEASLVGTAAAPGRVKNGNQDAYNNTIFQINFNEAINPVFVDKIIVQQKIDGNWVKVAGAVVTISNQYQTIEIKGPEECGVNSCGEKMYCWLDSFTYPSNVPISAQFRAEIPAAPLKRCAAANDAWCSGSFGGTCSASSRCSKASGGATVYFPQADIADIAGITGLIDMAGNSFNGSFNTTTLPNNKLVGISEGQSNLPTNSGGSGNPVFEMDATAYPPAAANKGDNFAWTFYVSNEIDNQSPLLKTIDPTGDQNFGYSSNEDFGRPVWLAFDRLMSSGSLKPGWGYDSVKNSKAWHNRFLALTTMTSGANPVGFWIGSNNVDVDGDRAADYTLAGIEHNRFDRSVRYAPLAGSGVMSITQNCFLPSAGPVGAGDGECKYVSGNPTGCAPVIATNPASYAKLKCSEVEGANVCAAGKDCKPLYNNAPSTSSGSWIITLDHPYNSGSSSTGCCLGKCE